MIEKTKFSYTPIEKSLDHRLQGQNEQRFGGVLLSLGTP